MSQHMEKKVCVHARLCMLRAHIKLVSSERDGEMEKDTAEFKTSDKTFHLHVVEFPLCPQPRSHRSYSSLWLRNALRPGETINSHTARSRSRTFCAHILTPAKRADWMQYIITSMTRRLLISPLINGPERNSTFLGCSGFTNV